MSSFVSENYVEEFACRTKLNYYNLIISQATDALNNAIVRKDDVAIQECSNRIADYQEKTDSLKREMILADYSISQYYEVTQLINSLVGLLIFPKQVFEGLLDGCRDVSCIERDLPTIGEIIKDDNNHCFSYKSFRKDSKGVEELSHNRRLASELKSILNEDSKRSEKKTLNRQINQLNTEKAELEKEVFRNLPTKAITTYTILQHMRNAVAHKHLIVFPEEKNQKIEAIVIRDIGLGKISFSNGDPVDVSYEHRESIIENDPRYGVFQLKISVDKLEDALIEICDLILGIAKKNS